MFNRLSSWLVLAWWTKSVPDPDSSLHPLLRSPGPSLFPFTLHQSCAPGQPPLSPPKKTRSKQQLPPPLSSLKILTRCVLSRRYMLNNKPPGPHIPHPLPKKFQGIYTLPPLLSAIFHPSIHPFLFVFSQKIVKNRIRKNIVFFSLILFPRL